MSGHRRRTGLLIPLFSFPRSTSWGIGDIGDIGALARWLRGAGLQVLQLLPLNEMANGQQSPYSAMSAMAIDPIYIDLNQVEEFEASGGEAALDPERRAELTRLREQPRVDYSQVRALKRHALQVSFARFLEDSRQGSARSRALRAFVAEESWWLEDYALFRALHDRYEHRAWTEWPHELQWRDPRAMDEARLALDTPILFAQYLQWIASEQWQLAKADARAAGVALFGDLPFMVDGDSADVWAHQDEFHLDRSVGVPPDAFSATGQDWGMPPYRWDAIAARDFAWLRQRARRSATLFDGYRVDHLVGFYRTYSRPKAGGPPAFEPADQAAQLVLGERNMEVFRSTGADVIAEDLGVVPDFVRESLARLGVPGFKVFRWERDWDAAGQPYRNPTEYPEISVAASGTHDTEPARTWWELASDEERQAVIAVINEVLSDRDALQTAGATFTPALRDALIELLFASRSNLVLLAVPDVFGWDDRINVPGTVTPENWSYRLPWPADAMGEEPEARERQIALRTLSERYAR